eukprot:Platyproteum_vivax@DN4326_c0_g1_i1.p2
MEYFFTHGYEYLFKFAVCLVETCSDSILEAKKDAGRILAILRLDKSLFPNRMRVGQKLGETDQNKIDTEEESFFVKLVENALNTDLSSAPTIDKLREEAVQQMADEAEKRRKREEELAALSDDEITFSDEE